MKDFYCSLDAFGDRWSVFRGQVEHLGAIPVKIADFPRYDF